MDVLGRADVEAAGRLLGDQHRRLVRQFARNDDLLQIAPRERSDGHALARDADCVAPNERARPLGHRLRIDETSPREGRGALEAHRKVVGGAGWERRSNGGAILRNIGEAGGPMRLDIGCARIDAADLDPAAIRAP